MPDDDSSGDDDVDDHSDEGDEGDDDDDEYVQPCHGGDEVHEDADDGLYEFRRHRSPQGAQ